MFFLAESIIIYNLCYQNTGKIRTPLSDAVPAVIKIPIAYNHSVDPPSSGYVNEEVFLNWLDQRVPYEFDGPVCIDWEAPYWSALIGPNITPHFLRHIQQRYVEVLAIGWENRPEAKFGFWGLPLMRHVNQDWLDQGLHLGGIIGVSDAIFPAIYDYWPNVDNTNTWVNYLTKSKEWVLGDDVPLIAVIGCRYYGNHDQRWDLMPMDEFQQAYNAAVLAGYDAVALWDAVSIHEQSSAAGLRIDWVWSCYLYALYYWKKTGGLPMGDEPPFHLDPIVDPTAYVPEWFDPLEYLPPGHHETSLVYDEIMNSPALSP